MPAMSAHHQVTAAEADTVAFDTLYDLLPGGDRPCIASTDGRASLTHTALKEFIADATYLRGHASKGNTCVITLCTLVCDRAAKHCLLCHNRSAFPSHAG
jgi:hypothetical protein